MGKRLVMLLLGLGACSSSGVPFSGEVVNFLVIDEANIDVMIEFTNDGDEPAIGECTVEAHDASSVVGFDVLTTAEDVAPGASERYHGAIRIEDEGAFRVADVTVSDCREAI